MPDNGWDAAGVSPAQENTDVLLSPELDRLFRMLSDRQCRLVLSLLNEQGIETKSDLVARDEIDERRLVHHCLPMLEEAGYIEWAQPMGALSKGPRFEEAESILDLFENHADELPSGWP